MAVVVETTIGDFTVDLFIDSRPQACKNFLKLCKMKYYNFSLFHSVQPNFLAQTGDPLGTGSGGESVYGILYGESARYFEAETMPKLKHNKPGLLSMVNCGNNMLGSQFFITLGDELVSLDGEHCVFGEISEGAEIVLKLNEAICDSQHRPYKDIRITHTIILEDPFDDPSGLFVPELSPEATQERLANGRIGADEEVDETQGLTAEQVEELRQEREAKARATILEIVGDLPDADMAPPENVLFVCKLNPVTTDDDLEIIFSRFGKVKSCEVIRDKNTGDSLQYAFVEFEEQKSCEDAYFKMDNVLIDDRRIHVDFSQSVAKMRWKGKGRGVEYFDNKDQSKDSRNSGNKEREGSRSKGDRSSRRERDREHEERDRRKDRGRDREEDRGRERDRERVRNSDDRHSRRDERERSRSDWRKKDKRDYREDDKRYEKRREVESSRKREDDSKRVSSSRRGEEKKLETKRLEEKKVDIRESRLINGKSCSHPRDLEKSDIVDKLPIKTEKREILDKERGKGSKYNSPLLASFKDEIHSDSLNDSQEIQTAGEDSEKSLNLSANKDIPEIERKLNDISSSRRSSKDDKKPSESITRDFENGRGSEGRSSQKDENNITVSKCSQEEDKKKCVKRKRKEAETRKKKKRRHSSSSESSSESSGSSDSSSSSDSSDYKHSKKKKLIVAKRYYRGGKLVKEVKKKKRTKDTSDSESESEESSDSDSKRKYKSKKHKKVTNSHKQGKKKSVHSSEDSQSESSSSEDSDEKNRKRKKKTNEKYIKKKSKHSKKRKRKKNYSSSSSESGGSVRSKSHDKKQKKTKNLKLSTNLVTTTSE